MHLILPLRVTDDSIALRKAALRRGWAVERLPGWRISSPPDPQDALAIYGEPLFARLVARQCDRFLLEPPADWLTHLPMDLLRRRVRAAQARDLASVELPAFIKPVDDKIFPAKVYRHPNELPTIADDAILISEPATMQQEFRVFCQGGEPVTASRYAVAGELDVAPLGPGDPFHKAVFDTAQRALHAAPAQTPTTLVVDVALLNDGQWVVVEANPCFGSGLYACDPDPVLDVLSAACLKPEDIVGIEHLVQQLVVE